MSSISEVHFAASVVSREAVRAMLRDGAEIALPDVRPLTQSLLARTDEVIE
jgi:hypothetical protein